MRLIPLTQGKFAEVDDEDFDRVSVCRWKYSKYGYVTRTATASCSYTSLSRTVLLLTDPNLQVDHIDLNKLNNQKSNLRVATSTQNNRNKRKQSGFTSQFKGVSWYYPTGRWVAFIQSSRRTINLGYYRNEVAAACAYDIAAVLLFGEFAVVNFI